ncbi:MAG: zeta toxin family protein [Candidatus Saccharimonadales bacterium]
MEDIKNQSIDWARKNKKDITKDLLDSSEYAVHEEKLAIFMAGSPGAGKTEYSTSLASGFDKKPLVIDPDKLRTKFSGYNGENSSLVQPGVSILVANIFDTIIRRGHSFILDGTFNHSSAISNIERCLDRGYSVQIHYLYQDPEVAWALTQDRETIEGRGIDRDVFIDHFVGSIKNVNLAISRFDRKIKVAVIVRNYRDEFERVIVNEPNIAKYVPNKYNRNDLEKIISHA